MASQPVPYPSKGSVMQLQGFEGSEAVTAAACGAFFELLQKGMTGLVLSLGVTTEQSHDRMSVNPSVREPAYSMKPEDS